MRALPVKRNFEAVFGCISLIWDTVRASWLEDRVTLENDPSAKPEAGISGDSADPLFGFELIPARKRQSPGSGAAPQFHGMQRCARCDLLCSKASSKYALTDYLVQSHLSALTSGMSFFAPGFAITNTASKGYNGRRAYPFLDEDKGTAAGRKNAFPPLACTTGTRPA